MTVLGVVPARLGSERLPRKPLHEIAGRPLIEWVWRRVSTFGVLDRAVVATDSEEIRDACRSFGAEVAMTAAAHPSGTHRVAEVAGRAEYSGYDAIVNVQGDEPFVTESQVAGAVACVTSGWEVGTVASPVLELEAWRDPSVVKVVRNTEGGALYFSRAPIPHVRGREPTAAEFASVHFLRHIGVYAYTQDGLRRWVALEPGPLESAERLEQLGPLAAGIGIGVAVVEGSAGGVDTPADAHRAEARLRAEGAMEREGS